MAPSNLEAGIDTNQISPHEIRTDVEQAQEASDSQEAQYSVFTKPEKRWIIFLIAMAGFFSPLSANIYFPAINYLARDLSVSLELINLTITAYLICQGIVPSLVGDTTDMVGRRPVYIAAFVVYLAANVGLALQDSYAALLVLRILQSSGSSGTIALAISVVADLAPPHERGRYVGAALCGPNTAPSLGPVLGGILAEKASWRWIFWFLSILSGLCLALIVICLPETARKLVGNGSIRPKRLNRSVASCISESKASQTSPEHVDPPLRCPNPLSCLRIVFHKDTALVLVANAIFYMNYSCMQASLSPLLMDIYGLNALEVGLTYLPYGIACGVASFLVGKVMDHDYKVTAAAVGFTIDKTKGDDLAKFPIEKARLRSIWYFVSISTACTIGYGWTLQARTHLAAPLILQFICGLTVTGTFNICNTLIVDLHPDRPATASASVSIVRCGVAAIGVSVLQFILDSLGPGWTFTLFGALGAATAPMLWVEWERGMRWRTDRRERKETVQDEK
ncbi:MAG: hypothetical protein L6R42_002304 [Xanthoria sp. 1 TBL-2021]|nr:MAG: hypothetical protein L6R42_002304 [Xanthoria sp. 1 TBL-2021]